jgi:hypothetical protein
MVKNLLSIIVVLILFAGTGEVVGQIDKEKPVTYSIDTAASVVWWWCDLHKGYLMLDRGKVVFKKNKLAEGEFDICMESITDTDIDYELMRITLENTLKSADFLDTPKYHYSKFIIDHVDYRNDSAFITGDLTFLGVTKCISFMAKVTVENDSVFAQTEKITIDRTDYGNTAMSKEDAKSDKSFIVPDEIIIAIDLKGYKSREVGN